MALTLDELPFVSNTALFGSGRATGLVGLLETDEGVDLFLRREGVLRREQATFRPFLWLTDPALLQGMGPRKPIEHEVIELAGEGHFRYLVRCPDPASLKRVSQHLAKASGVAAGSSRSPQFYLSDMAHQFLLDSGCCYFRGLQFEDVVRMQLFVVDADETGERPLERVLLSDSRGRRLELAGDEQVILDGLEEFLAECDPDVIEGHDLFKSHLVHLQTRARALGRPLRLGRDDGALSYRRTRMQIAEKTIDYLRWKVGGRELVDHWLVAQLYDVSARELVSYDLADVAEGLGVESDDPLEQIERVSTALSYPYFLQAQIFPYPYEQVILRGNATRINTLFLREYLRQNSSLPQKPETEGFAGALTSIESTGVARNVLHCDVQSLYPSLILHYDLVPRADRLLLFRNLLQDLRAFRLEARRREKEAGLPRERKFYGGLQSTFKILINSFYGYLGFGQGHFADFGRAAEVTAKGRELLTFQMDWLRQRGAHILEVDTDGIYFLAPQGAELIEALDRELPAELRVELEGRYPAMFCHKAKNYALLTEEGELIIRGSGLRSRSFEPYLREALEHMIRLALEGRLAAADDPLEKWRTALQARTLPIRLLGKTDVLSDPLWLYKKKIEGGGRNRAAAYELALQSSRRFLPGEPLTYYVTGEKASVTAYNHARLTSDYDPAQPDENVAYYLKKLADLEKKFLPALLQEVG